MYKLREEKNAMRKRFLQMRRELDPQKKEEMDGAIFKALTSLVTYRYAHTVLTYYPKISEVNTLPVIKACLEAGKRVALPRCNESDCTMKYHYIEELSDLEQGVYNIPAPKEHCPVFSGEDTGKSILAIVPALSFDKKGYRLGYGKGYYDRYMDTLRATKAGLVYTDFIADTLPIGRYDLAVDLLVTEKGVRIIEKNR